jgi:hypothetical protein
MVGSDHISSLPEKSPHHMPQTGNLSYHSAASRISCGGRYQILGFFLHDGPSLAQHPHDFVDHVIAQSAALDVRDAHEREIGGRCFSKGNFEEQGIRA